MRFERKRRWGTFALTRPRLAAAEADMRAAAHRAAEQRWRDFEARVWRESRRDARAATPQQQAAIRAHWQAWRGPATALYFRYVVDLYTGVIELRRPASQARPPAVAAGVMAGQPTQGTLG
jgi:hypothetical protein